MADFFDRLSHAEMRGFFTAATFSHVGTAFHFLRVKVVNFLRHFPFFFAFHSHLWYAIIDLL